MCWESGEEDTKFSLCFPCNHCSCVVPEKGSKFFTLAIAHQVFHTEWLNSLDCAHRIDTVSMLDIKWQLIKRLSMFLFVNYKADFIFVSISNFDPVRSLYLRKARMQLFSSNGVDCLWM